MWQDCATHSEGHDTLPVSWSSQWRTHQRKWGSWGFHALCDIPSGGSLNGSHNPATTQGKSQNESDNVKDCSFQLPKCNDLNLFFVIYDGDEVSLVFELLAGPQKQSEDVTLGSDEKSFIIFRLCLSFLQESRQKRMTATPSHVKPLPIHLCSMLTHIKAPQSGCDVPSQGGWGR